MSYHSDGRQHHKGYDRVLGKPIYRQPPDHTLHGTEQVVTTPISAKAACAMPTIVDPGKYTDVFEIAADELDPERAVVGVIIDLLEPGGTGSSIWGGHLIRRKMFRDGVPWIAVSLWNMQEEPPIGGLEMNGQ